MARAVCFHFPPRVHGERGLCHVQWRTLLPCVRVRGYPRWTFCVQKILACTRPLCRAAHVPASPPPPPPTPTPSSPPPPLHCSACRPGPPSVQDAIAQLKEKGLSEDKIVEYQAAFQLFDGGGRGIIDVSTLGSLLNGTFGVCATPCSLCTGGGMRRPLLATAPLVYAPVLHPPFVLQSCGCAARDVCRARSFAGG